MSATLHDQEPNDASEDLPPGSYQAKWLGGVLLACTLIGYGLACVLVRRGVIPGRTTTLTVTGRNAVAFGILCIGSGVAAHFHLFYYHCWGTTGQLPHFAIWGRTAGLVILAIGTVWLVLGLLG
ncbi:MAG: hypothetical protein JXA69_17750 [Phycisphaerae bacterium]|nr:hypothetical protein [Phycisphaerae bacterium]